MCRFLILIMLVCSELLFAPQARGSRAAREKCRLLFSQVQTLPLAERLPTIVASNYFNTSRGFYSYTTEFSDPFLQDLSRLNGDSHWIDAGAGELFAIEEYLGGIIHPTQAGIPLGKSLVERLKPAVDDPLFEKHDFKMDREKALGLLREILDKPISQKASVTGISYRISRPEFPNPDGRIRILRDRYFEDIPDAEILGTSGKADIITDFYGIMAYSKYDEVLRRYVNLIKEDGTIYLALGSDKDGFGHLSQIRDTQGNQQSLAEWLQNLEGLDVEIYGSFARSRENLIERVARIRKKPGANVSIPNLQLIQTFGHIMPGNQILEVHPGLKPSPR